jgi:hypothetical protein
MSPQDSKFETSPTPHKRSWDPSIPLDPPQ